MEGVQIQAIGQMVSPIVSCRTQPLDWLIGSELVFAMADAHVGSALKRVPNGLPENASFPIESVSVPKRNAEANNICPYATEQACWHESQH